MPTPAPALSIVTTPSIGSPTFHLFLTPVVVGGGNQTLPDNVRLKLELLDERRFGSGVVYLRYRTRT